MDHKTFAAFTLKTDQQQGIVEAIVAVMGNDDQTDDIIHNGAFVKTITESRGKIRVLDQHQTDSVMRVIGKPLEMREISRDQLPLMLIEKYPEATGGLFTKTQYLIGTPEGKGVFDRIAAGAIDEYSIGYDPLDVDYSKIKNAAGIEKTVRNLRTIKLYEYSPVIWGANSATQTLSAKAADEAAAPAAPTDEAKDMKPWNVFHEGDKWNVYKLDADGKPTGDPLGSHDTEDEARAQVRALYANEGKSIKAAQSFTDALTTMLNERNLNEMRYQLECALHESLESIVEDAALDAPARETALRQTLAQYSDALVSWYSSAIEAGLFEQEENESEQMQPYRMSADTLMAIKAGRVFAARNLARLQKIKEEIEALMSEVESDKPEDMLTDYAPADKQAAVPDADAQAGPSATTPTDETLKASIEIEIESLKLLEV